jgi:hypothetical protein
VSHRVTLGGRPAGAPQGHLQGCARWVCRCGSTVGTREGPGPGGVGGPGGGSWLEAEAAGSGGAAVLEVVEAGGDAGGVEGPVGVEGLVGVGEGEPVEVRAE